MKFTVQLLIAFLLAFHGGGVYGLDAPYSTYEAAPRFVTEMEWRLLQVAIPLAPKEAYVSFDGKEKQFTLTVWVMTSDASTMTTQLLRENLISVIDLAKALLEAQFPEFKKRSNRDLIVKCVLGRSERDIIATYDREGFRFTEAYYVFLKEIGKR